jgi:hypothetical protein
MAKAVIAVARSRTARPEDAQASGTTGRSK